MSHNKTGYKKENQMIHVLINAELMTVNTRKMIKGIIEACNVCKKWNKLIPRDRTPLPKVTTNNQIITWDLKELRQLIHNVDN